MKWKKKEGKRDKEGGGEGKRKEMSNMSAFSLVTPKEKSKLVVCGTGCLLTLNYILNSCPVSVCMHCFICCIIKEYIFFRCVASLLTHLLTAWLTNFILKMSRYRDQNTLNFSLQSRNLALLSLLTHTSFSPHPLKPPQPPSPAHSPQPAKSFKLWYSGSAF